jgi:citrate synthase
MVNQAAYETLLDALMRAHHQSCFRDNASSAAVANAAAGSGDLAKAIAAGLMSLGAKHAPLEATVRFLSLDHPEEAVSTYLAKGQRVPGWGGTFQKDRLDPIWIPVEEVLRAGWSEFAAKLDDVTSALHYHDKHVFPNPSAYTACAALIMGITPKMAVAIFIRGRISGWCEVAAEYLED